MKRALSAAAALALVLTWAQPAASEDLASSIVGVWKNTSFVRKEVATGTGYAYYSKGGHFLIFTVAQDRKKNEKADPTDSERIELFKSMFRWGGTYKTEGNKVVYNVNIAWVPSWVGTTRTYQVETTSNKLTVTTPPFKSVSDGQALLSSRLRRGKRFREGICKILIDSLFISTVALCTLRLAGTRGRSIGNVAIGNVANDVVESCEAIIAETNIPKSPRSTPSRQLKN